MRRPSCFTVSFKDHGPRHFVAMGAVATCTAFLIAACSGPLNVPEPLESVAHHSESLYDAARANNWAAAVGQLDTLNRAAADLSAMKNGSAQLNASLVSQLAVCDTSVPNRDRVATLRSANEITRLAAELTRPYKPAVPVEITLLDYSGRELEVWAEMGDLAKLRAATTTMRQTWNAVRKRVEKQRSGPAAAASFEALVARAESAKIISDYAAVATPVLDEVDTLERLFPKTDAQD